MASKKPDKSRTARSVHLETMLDVCNAAVLEIGSDKTILYANRAAHDLFEYENTCLIGQSLDIITPEEYRAQISENFEHFFALKSVEGNDQNDAIIAQTLPGHRIYVSVHLTYCQHRDEDTIVATVTESETLNLTRFSLSKLNDRFKVAIESANIGVWEYNLKSRNLIWDEGMCHLHDLKESQFVGHLRDWMNYFHPDDLERARSHINTKIDARDTINDSFKVITAAGRNKYLKCYGHVLSDEKGEPEGIGHVSA